MKGGAHLAASTLVAEGKLRPLVIAMPSDGLWGDGSGYLAHGNEDYETWIVDDVPTAVREVVPSVAEASPLFISGLSMGGYGALRLGAKYAERFAGISAHSAITRPEQFSMFVEAPVSEYVCGPAEESDPLYWMKKKRDVLPPLRFDCGLLDRLLEPNRELHAALTAENMDHIYDEFPGEHCWPYWQEHIYETLLFVETVMR